MTPQDLYSEEIPDEVIEYWYWQLDLLKADIEILKANKEIEEWRKERF